jgi:LmbE family N-acetylglucosaminyl deacetylase
MQTYAFEPNIIMDITDTYQMKLKAIKCYSSQFYTDDKNKLSGKETFISSKGFMDYIEARSKFYGFMAGVRYAEAFYTEEKIKITANTLFKI